MTDQQVKKMALKIPFEMEWVEYKGETFVAQFNYERSRQARKPMLDLSICMTRAINQVIIDTVQYDKSKFKPSRLGKAFSTKKTKRKFYNRRFKNGDYILHLEQDDSYTDNEMNIGVENISYMDWTMITKEDLKRFANELKQRKERVFSDCSNYASNPYFLAEKKAEGYFFTIKGVVSISMNLPFKKVDKLIDFLNDL